MLELSDYCVQDIAQTVRSTLEPLAADKKLAFKVDVLAFNFIRRSGCYSVSGVGLAAGGSMPKVLAVIQVIEKLPIEATNATRLSNPIVFSPAA